MVKDLLASRCKRRRCDRQGHGLADYFLDLLAYGRSRDPEGTERLRRDTFSLLGQSEQDVLGAAKGVIQATRFLLRQHQHPLRPGAETFKHSEKLLLMSSF